MEKKDYTRLPINDLISQLKTDTEKGLSKSAAQKRLKLHGPNTIRTDRSLGRVMEFLTLFKNPLVLTLLAAGAISMALGEQVSGGIIFGMVMLSIITDYWQERDARNAAERLKNEVKTRAQVMRDGKVSNIDPENLVPGDILMLSPGNIVSADGRILEANDLHINQASLTGESYPVEKSTAAPPPDASTIAEWGNMVFMGSSVVSGTAKILVLETGGATQFGKIAASLVREPEQTDFSKGIQSFGTLILRVTIVLVLFIFLVNSLLKHNFLESFLFAVAVAVGLTPEMLPMIMSVTMAKGSVKMAKKGVIVKKLAAIPNFGSMEVLCTDKTGTLTEGEIQLVKHLDTKGEDSDKVFELTYFNSFFQNGVPDPLDAAILRHADFKSDGWAKVDEIPFDFSRKRESVALRNPAGENILLCKGAPEEIFKIIKSDETEIVRCRELCDNLNKEGFRVLALAHKILPSNQNICTKQDEQDLDLQGFVAFLDPPKPGAGEVIRQLADIGVEVKIITGDNLLVAEKICAELGLTVRGTMQGFELDGMADEALQHRAMETTIFARFSPEQKNRVIRALKPRYRSVGYMGDGINDAPSLRAADVGISVNNATDVAKDAASIILTDKDLSVLRDGILEGRKTFGNTQKYIFMALSSNFGNMFSVAVAAVFLPFLPMLPIQILINNFLYDSSQFAIPYDAVDETTTLRPQRWDMRLVYRFMWVFGLTSSVFDLLTFLLLYKLFEVTPDQFRTGWFMESLATQTLVVFVIRTRISPFWKSEPSKVLVASMLLCVGIGWYLPYSFASKWLGFQPLPVHILAALGGIVLFYLILAEVVKRVAYGTGKGENEEDLSLIK